MILVAGATGYLGRYIVQEALQRGHPTRALVRSPHKLADGSGVDLFVGHATQPSTLNGVMSGVDTVISALGITRQRDGLTYDQVDYAANRHLLDAAVAHGVRKFVYVSVLRGPQLRHLAICAAKERFADALAQAPIEHAIVRPGGYFSDLSAFYDMARQGRAYVFGDGTTRANPIHGADLARVCLDMVHSSLESLDVGGPNVLTQHQVAELAFKAAGKHPRIIHVPDWLRRLALKLGRWVLNPARFGPIEFFLHAMATDMVGPAAGTHTLADHFERLHAAHQGSIKTL
ncbi:MAG: SDR family oxidoreductase [Rhodothermales bacterium]